MVSSVVPRTRGTLISGSCTSNSGRCQPGASDTSTPGQRLKSGTISIAAGTLDAPTKLKTIRHIFVEHMGDYYKIGDKLQRLPGTMGAN